MTASRPGVTIIPIHGHTPRIHDSAFIAPGCTIIGNVEIGADSSVWYNCVLRADVSRIVIGERSNIQDGSVVHCDPEALAAHIEHRINPGRHRTPSRFVHGDLDRAKAVLLNQPTDRIQFAIYGVQPGISKVALDEHLTDLMAFSLDYVRRGGAAVGKWLVSP